MTAAATDVDAEPPVPVTVPLTLRIVVVTLLATPVMLLVAVMTLPTEPVILAVFVNEVLVDEGSLVETERPLEKLARNMVMIEANAHSKAKAPIMAKGTF